MAPKRTRTLADVHEVSLALGKARSMASVLDQLGEKGNNLVHALENGSHPDDTRDWLHVVVSDALRAALNEAEAAFRKSLAPEARGGA